MKVFMFHLMPYAYLDMSFSDKYRSAWVVLPNTYFDPQKGHELYNRYLDELELAAELGFDGISVNEHHQNAYGLMPSPVVHSRDGPRRRRSRSSAMPSVCASIRSRSPRSTPCSTASPAGG
jgi:hypothetical protein